VKKNLGSSAQRWELRGGKTKKEELHKAPIWRCRSGRKGTIVQGVEPGRQEGGESKNKEEEKVTKDLRPNWTALSSRVPEQSVQRKGGVI